MDRVKAVIISNDMNVLTMNTYSRTIKMKDGTFVELIIDKNTLQINILGNNKSNHLLNIFNAIYNLITLSSGYFIDTNSLKPGMGIKIINVDSIPDDCTNNGECDKCSKENCKYEGQGYLRSSNGYECTSKEYASPRYRINKNIFDAITDKAIQNMIRFIQLEKDKKKENISKKLIIQFFLLQCKSYENIVADHKIMMLMHTCEGLFKYMVQQKYIKEDTRGWTQTAKMIPIFSIIDKREYNKIINELGIESFESFIESLVGERNEMSHLGYNEKSVMYILEDKRSYILKYIVKLIMLVVRANILYNG